MHVVKGFIYLKNEYLCRIGAISHILLHKNVIRVVFVNDKSFPIPCSYETEAKASAAFSNLATILAGEEKKKEDTIRWDMPTPDLMRQLY